MHHEGAGHTLAIQSNEEIIREFALKNQYPSSPINTPAALGGVGATVSSQAFTLGCGAVEARHS